MRWLVEAVSQDRDHPRRGYLSRLLASFGQSVAKPASELAQQEAGMIEPLSERELEVLRLLRTELSGPEIARQLVVSLNTLRTHTKSIFSKLRVNNRQAAVRRAEQLHLF
jgi:LuxR family maltose regulon positive regulatory protein